MNRLLGLLGEDERVLDVGGWGSPLARADSVIDLMPYATRGLYPGPGSGGTERFGADTWVERDVCDREPWPFDDGAFDFVVCSHTLEDVRDPVWVCAEMQRVGRAGYVEVPSRLEEQSYGVEGPWVGRAHHRWLIDVEDDRLTFVFKSHVLHRRRSAHFPFGFHQRLSAEERVQTLWWEGGFEFGERAFYEIEEHDRYLEEFVARNLEGRPVPGRWRGIAVLLADRAWIALGRRRPRPLR